MLHIEAKLWALFLSQDVILALHHFLESMAECISILVMTKSVGFALFSWNFIKTLHWMHLHWYIFFKKNLIDLSIAFSLYCSSTFSISYVMTQLGHDWCVGSLGYVVSLNWNFIKKLMWFLLKIGLFPYIIPVYNQSIDN